MNETQLNPFGDFLLKAAKTVQSITDDATAAKKESEMRIKVSFAAEDERIRKAKEAERQYWLRENSISSAERNRGYRSNLTKYLIECPEAIEKDFIAYEINRLTIQRNKVDINDPIQRNVGHILDRVVENLKYKADRIEADRLANENKRPEETIKLKFQGDREMVTVAMMWLADAGILDMSDAEIAKSLEQSALCKYTQPMKSIKQLVSNYRCGDKNPEPKVKALLTMLQTTSIKSNVE